MSGSTVAGRSCTCCTHPDSAEIDAAIAAGESVRSIGKRFGVSPWAVSRHHTRHLSPALTAVEVVAGEPGREALPERVERLYALAEAMYTEALAAGHGAQALNLLKEMRGQLELIGKATGELDTRPQVTVNLMASPEWLMVRDVILSSLMQYPEARACVSGRLLELEAGDS
jgi:hypothetical protein